MVLRIKGLSVMNGTNVVFDTCAIVKLLDRQYDLLSLGINVDKVQLFTSNIVRIELLSKPNMSSGEERDIREFLKDLTVVSIDEAIERETIAIRRSNKLKLPDCIIAATSIVLNAILLTDDDQLINLSQPRRRDSACHRGRVFAGVLFYVTLF
jgi:predicted nucleic acid-binding protein